jgi:hypothetical protein
MVITSVYMVWFCFYEKIHAPKLNSFSRLYTKIIRIFFQNHLQDRQGRSTFAAAFEKAPYSGFTFQLLTAHKMNTLSYRTESVSKEKAEHKWYVVDAENQVVGRLCTHIASRFARQKQAQLYAPRRHGRLCDRDQRRQSALYGQKMGSERI